MYAEDSYDYLLAARSDGACLFASSARDHKEYTSSFRVGWGSYQWQAGDDDSFLGQVVCTWAEMWATDWRSWTQVEKTDQLTSTIDLDKGLYTKREAGAFVAPTVVEDVEVASLEILLKKMSGGSSLSLPPSLRSQKVLTLTKKPSAEGMLKVICTDVGGSECASLDVDPQSQTLATFRDSVAKTMGMEVAQIQLVLTNGKFLGKVLNDSLLADLIDCAESVDVTVADSE